MPGRISITWTNRDTKHLGGRDFPLQSSSEWLLRFSLDMFCFRYLISSWLFRFLKRLKETGGRVLVSGIISKLYGKRKRHLTLTHRSSDGGIGCWRNYAGMQLIQGHPSETIPIRPSLSCFSARCVTDRLSVHVSVKLFLDCVRRSVDSHPLSLSLSSHSPNSSRPRERLESFRSSTLWKW